MRKVGAAAAVHVEYWREVKVPMQCPDSPHVFDGSFKAIRRGRRVPSIRPFQLHSSCKASTGGSEGRRGNRDREWPLNDWTGCHSIEPLTRSEPCSARLLSTFGLLWIQPRLSYRRQRFWTAASSAVLISYHCFPILVSAARSRSTAYHAFPGLGPVRQRS